MTILCAALVAAGTVIVPTAPGRAAPGPTIRIAAAQGDSAGPKLSRQDAAGRATKRYGGKVLDVELKRPKNERPFYRVKLLADGKVRIVRVDANSGTIAD